MKRIAVLIISLIMILSMGGCSFKDILPEKDDPDKLITADFGGFKAQVRKSWVREEADDNRSNMHAIGYTTKDRKMVFAYVKADELFSDFYNMTWNKTPDFIFDTFVSGVEEKMNIISKSDLLESETTITGDMYDTGWFVVDNQSFYIYMYIMVNQIAEEIHIFSCVYEDETLLSEAKKETRRLALSMEKNESGMAER